MVTRQAHAWSMGAGIFQSTPSLRMLTANLYNDTQYFLYRFGEIHNFVLYTSYLLRFTLPWCGFAGHFSVRSSRKFYDCLGFALHRQTQHLIHYTISVEGELAVPRSGRRPLRPTANFSRPRDTSHGLSSNIKALGTLYHKCEGRNGGAAKREEVDPTDSQFLQAQGHITSFVLKHRGPGHSIS